MNRPHLLRTAIAGLGALTLATAALAQTTPVQPQPRDPNMPAPQNTVPEKVEPRPGETTGTLSDRLEKSDGVIRPNDTGAGRVITPPATGTMTVIPPPGTPGSASPNAEPK